MHQLFKSPLLSFGFTAVGLMANPTTEQVEFFEKNIRPALAEHCYECHNSSDKAKGGLALDWRDGLVKGSDSGSVIVAGKPFRRLRAISLLGTLRRLTFGTHRFLKI